MRKFILAATAALLLVPAVPAEAKGLKKTYSKLYTTVAKEHGKRTPGRNIVKHGVRYKWVSEDGKRSHWDSRDAKRSEVKRSVVTFKRWLAPPVAPAVPAGSATAAVYQSGGSYSIPREIVMCESGGDYSAVNGSNPNRPAGAYQIITSTWTGYGGGKYAPTADAATPAQQDEIASRIWAGGAGRGQWEC